MKIYADPTKGWFHGLGDVVAFAWLGQGIREAGGEVEFFASGWHEEVLRMFGMPIARNPEGAVYTNEGYEKCVAAKSPLNYIQWIAKHLGITAEPKRPKCYPTPCDREFGRRAAGDVLIFPHGVWSPRIWPKSYFVELALLLKKEGYRVVVCTKERDYAFFMPFHCIVGKSFSFIAGAIQASKLVIGNDSGPAHLAGTIGTKTIAIHGPTQGKRIYGHIPEVEPFEKRSLECAGCHCLPPWRDSCQIGCHQLYRTFPEEVFSRCVQILGRKRAHLMPANEPLETFNRELVAA